MGEYPAAEYRAEASTLEAGLVEAIETDLGLSPAEYLAAADAAVDAADVLEHLEEQDVDTTDAVLDGTTLTVLVDSAETAEAVAEVGATPVFEPTPEMVADYSDVQFEAAADLVGGTGWAIPGTDLNKNGIRDDGYVVCSVAFNGRLKAGGAHQVTTAGHCLDGTAFPDASASALVQSRPNDPFQSIGATLGNPVTGSVRFGAAVDSARMSVESAWTPRPSVSVWGGGSGSPSAGTPVSVRGATAAVVGARLCKSGRTTGWTCGTVRAVDQAVFVSERLVNAIIADTCVRSGDSGGAALIGDYAAGITSGASATCTTGGLSAFFPVVSPAGPDVLDFNSAWELSVAISKPQITSILGGRSYADVPVRGTVPNAPAGTRVSLYLDGATTATSTSTLTSRGGSFSLPLGGASLGSHAWRIVASQGVYSSATTTGTVALVARPATDRLFGPSRYETAIATSVAAFPSPAAVPIVYLASGEGFADALSAAPAAAKGGGPLLLTPRSGPTAAILAEVRRLNPAKIVIVGGTGAVAASADATLRSIAPVQRIGGTDRYDTSRKLINAAFPAPTQAVYVASGANYPDALAAGAAAGSVDSPVVLTRAAALDDATRLLVQRLAPQRIRVAGGVLVVSNTVLAQLTPIAADTRRVAGTDRYATAAAINTDAFGSATRAFVASGLNFPDALAGAAYAGRVDAPLYLSAPTCLPAAAATDLLRLGVGRVTFFGSTAVLSSNVFALRPC
ncbi:cell wall-binding repeat-containing protein [Agromyces sp. SYSU K20354]|uniref:cell wall-binding repeat-containing protein n=1 Tax=Agromyces cavernae TaxID=2898659 RepID=UPI001E449D1D|nr:cell wall-binding repeat-containing protein [Agromyces cavernae]MCD2443560.1 cell wall-binding repeat-containing protein [Agromyces cavernae]